MKVEEQQALELIGQLRDVAELLAELVQVDSGEFVSVPRQFLIGPPSAQMGPFDTWRTTGEGAFHSLAVDNMTAYPLYVRFDGTPPTAQNADGVVPINATRIFTRMFDRQVSIGVDPSVVLPAPVRVLATAYARPLVPGVYALAGAGAMVGTVASGTADDASNPVKMGGVVHTALQTYADGQRAQQEMGTRGQSLVGIPDDPTAAVARVQQATDAFSGGNRGLVGVVLQMLYGGATWGLERTPVVFKAVGTAGTGTTTVWTPTAGKRFRLLRYMLVVSGNAAFATGPGLFSVGLRDQGVDMGLGMTAVVPVAAAAGPPLLNSGWIDLGNGILSAAPNNILQINLGAALTSGEARAIVCGTEE